MLRTDLEAHLNTYLNVSLIPDYCPNGLQIEGKKEIRKLATAVSANLMTLEKAVEEKVDALIVHHGLFWNNDPYPIVGSKRAKIDLLLKHGISLFAYHVPLDAHQEVGNNWKAAHDLGWQKVESFGEFNGIMIGVRGEFPEQPIETFIAKMEAYYEHKALVALGGKKSITNCALISGGAYRQLAAAARASVQCFITGNFDEPAWGVAYEEEINFLALGHSATEKVGPKALADYLQKTFNLSCSFLDIPNPF